MSVRQHEPTSLAYGSEFRSVSFQYMTEETPKYMCFIFIEHSFVVSFVGILFIVFMVFNIDCSNL